MFYVSLLCGFISLDCGGDGDFTDDIGIQWTSDDKFVYGGKTANLSVQNDLPKQLKTVRYFPVDDRKYCYTMNVSERTRYLVRATFLYGNFENSNIFPKFDLSLGATPWTTVVVYDDTTPTVVEAIILASAPTLSVCLSNASTGQAPFISTLELRQLNGSLYETDYENQFFLKLSARINFGAESNASVSSLWDPKMRTIWLSWYHGILRKVGRKRVVTHAYQHHGPGYNAVQKKRPGTLSGKNITGSIPVELTKLPGLVELRLDGNSFSGPIPDFIGCQDLQYIHLEDNQLTGALPSSLGDLPNLKQLYIQNNKLSGEIPQALFRKGIIFNFSGNSNLHVAHNTITHPVIIIVCVVIGAFVLLVAAVGCYLFAYNRKKKPSDAPAKQLSSPLSEVTTESVHRFALSEIEDATDRFGRRIGYGGFGIVYYGKLADGREIAQDGKNILVYEFMHEGTLKEHIRGGPAYVKVTSWVKRLEIAEDAAKGCSPTIIHRDLKSSNILLDKNMRAKVADFGISKPVVNGSHVSTMVRGTFGYLDPEYYGSQQLTEKSDIYSFGVILLELISGQEPISDDHFGPHCRSIVAWATSHIESGNIHAIIDQSLDTGYDLQSVWKVAEVAIMCLKPTGRQRPSMSEVLKEIQDAIALERGGRELVPSIQHPVSKCSPSVNMDSVVLEQNSRFDELLDLPGLR
uniref:non-specific serine/threonine protein kinase n=1 Tax=Oryza meridionalis TaxID=40149 RepID=A0A0E0FB73_9ORYZ